MRNTSKSETRLDITEGKFRSYDLYFQEIFAEDSRWSLYRRYMASIVDDSYERHGISISTFQECAKTERTNCRRRQRERRDDGERKGLDEDRQISSLLRYDLISARRRPLKTALRNPLLGPTYILIPWSLRRPFSTLYTIPAAELRRANLRLKVGSSSKSFSRNIGDWAV